MNGQWAKSLALPQDWDTFSFSASPDMPPRFSFSRPSSPPSLNPCYPKRPRSLTDVDGEGSVGLQKKKRRLRLVFVTSRLSRPFSAPPTHIVSRGSSKIAVWAKQKALGRNLLRKAAIMNRLRKHALSIRNSDPRRFDAVGQMIIFFSRPNASLPATTSTSFTQPSTCSDNSAEVSGRPSTSPFNSRNEHLPLPAEIPYNPPSPPSTPRRQYIPLPPSPLDLTNYDIFDKEDGFFDSDSDSESESHEGKSSRVYSDFNILDPSEPVVDDHDAIASFESLTFGSQLLLMESLKEDEKSTEIRLEQERQKEVSFVHFGF
ncbi:hypothetical protein AJ79_06825 [Helicocarpus griseus UAMH5409]|uniref:Uncharacterized protein n=1 Tax=Helicocarpus griseus UAMH5409 TaxID=1447875 RepID=A0A2B7X8G8_9EURO|nr:hypothetical protein AJ79_06825 [Helicocarpus griseus UAMH5409]